MPIKIQTTNNIYDSLEKCTPSKPLIGTNCRIINIEENIVPVIAISFNKEVPSLSFFKVTSVELR